MHIWSIIDRAETGGEWFLGSYFNERTLSRGSASFFGTNTLAGTCFFRQSHIYIFTMCKFVFEYLEG